MFLEELARRKKLLTDNVIKLERHQFASELNKLHLKKGVTYNVRGITDINTAIDTIFNTVQWERLKQDLIEDEEISK